MTNAVVFKPVPIHFSEAEAEPKLSPKMERKNTYTLEHRPKDSTIRRRPPVSPRRMPESFTQQQETPKRSLRQLLKKAISQEDLTIDSSTLTPSHFSLHVPATPVFSPVSPRRTLTSLKEMPKRSPMRFPKRAKSQEDLMRERNTLTTSHSSLQLPTWQLPAISPRRTLGQSSLAFREPSEFPSPTREQPLLFQGDNKGESKQSPNHRLPANDEDVAPAVQKESDKMPKFLVKTQSDGCLLSGIKSESDNNLCQTLSQEILRDSGFHDCHSSSGSLQSLQEATANISSLARFSHKAPLIRANSDNSPTTSDPRFTEDVSSGDTDLHASKSMELLTNADLETIRDIAMSAVDSPEEVSQNASSKPPPPIPPPIPERSCAYIHNCTIPDEDLLRQGKRISQMLQLTPKKEERERKPLRSLQAAFGRISTLLRKGNSSSHSSPSPTSGRKGLGFPDSPVLRRKETHPGDISPPKKPAEINSLGVRMSRVEYAEVNIWEKPSLDFSKSSTPPPAVARKPGAGTSPMTSPLSYDIATALSSSSGTRIGGRATTVSSRPLNTQNKKLSLSASDLTKDRGNALENERQDFSNTVPHPKHQVLPKKRRTVIDEYDIAVPVKIPQREHRYLTVLIETPPPSPQHGKLPPSKYENNTLEMKSSSCIQLDGRDVHIYSTPKPKSVSHATPSTGACTLVAKYENQGIQNGPSNRINFGNSPLHVYDAATPSSNSKLPPNKYENSALEMKSSSCSQIDGSNAQSSSSACGPMATYVYENQSIQNGPNSGINFGNSPLHVYQAVPPSSNSKLPSSKYENSALEMNSSGCIQLDGRDTPNPQSVSHVHTSNDACAPVANYVNQSIQNGPNSGINFGNSPLHVYDAAPPSSTSSHRSGSIPPPPPLPPKPATQHQTRGPQAQQKLESSGSTQPLTLPPKPEVVGWSSSGHTTLESQKQTTSKDTSKSKKILLLPPKPCTSSQDLPASSSSLPSPPYYQDNYSKLLWNVKKHPQDFTAPAPSQLISDALLPVDTNSGIYEPIPDLECAVDSGAPPPLPPLSLEMPVYSKLSFNKPLPPEPALNTDSDSDLYDTIPSLPSSDDEEYDDIRLPARVPVTLEHSLPLKPKKWDQLWQQPTTRVRDEEYDDIQLPARVPVTPEYSLPLKPKKFDLGPPKVPAKPKSCPPANPSASQKIVLSESSKSADGKTYKSWTSSNAIGNPQEELKSKLKRRLNIIQAQLSHDDSSSPPSSSATQPESRTAWKSNSEVRNPVCSFL